MDLTQDINSLTNFKRRTGDFLDQLRTTGRPIVLTINGKAELVVQSAQSFQRVADLLEQADAQEAIRQGLKDIKAGKGRRAQDALEEIRKKHKLPRRP